MAGTLIAEQPNGELIHVEHWVYEAWRHGALRDPFLTAPLYRAVDIRYPRWATAVDMTDRNKATS
jgi:hypothetical protein